MEWIAVEVGPVSLCAEMAQRQVAPVFVVERPAELKPGNGHVRNEPDDGPDRKRHRIARHGSPVGPHCNGHQHHGQQGHGLVPSEPGQRQGSARPKGALRRRLIAKAQCHQECQMEMEGEQRVGCCKDAIGQQQALAEILKQYEGELYKYSGNLPKPLGQ